MSGDPAVVVIGDLVTDVVAAPYGPLEIGSDSPAEVRVRGGGSGANVAAWLAVQGVDVAFVARVGDDAEGRARADELAALGVEPHLTLDPQRPTGTVVVVAHEAERTMLPDRGANLRLAPADVPPALFTGGRHLHLSGYTLFGGGRAAGLRALRLARDAGMSVSVDPNSSAPLRAIGPDQFLRWTAGAGLCLPNVDEAAVLSGVVGPEPAALALAGHYGEVVVTMGADGALWSDGTHVLHSPAAGAAVVDTTGAGDAFTAGYLRSHLDGGSAGRRLRDGLEMAAASVGVRGGRPPPREG